MKKFIILLAVSLSTVATINAQDVVVNYPYFTGPGINTTANVTKHEPILAPIHLAAGGYSQYQKVVGWNDKVETVPVHVTGYELEKQGYRWATPVPDSPNWWFWNINSDIPWGWMFFYLVLIAGIALLAWLIIRIVRYSNQPLPTPIMPGNVVNNHYYQPQAPAQMGSNVPSYDANEINSVIATLKSGLRSGSVYYAHGNGERLHIKVHGPWENSTDVPAKVPATPAAPPTGPNTESKG